MSLEPKSFIIDCKQAETTNNNWGDAVLMLSSLHIFDYSAVSLDIEKGVRARSCRSHFGSSVWVWRESKEGLVVEPIAIFGA